jgi:hypothetical protein
MMGQQKQSGGNRASAAEQAARDEEVLRASRELTAYFRGRRTEREARAALKIIKAFVRSRERLDPKDRAPLPGMGKPADHATTHRRPSRRKSRGKVVTPPPSLEATVSLEPTVNADAEVPSSSHH